MPPAANLFPSAEDATENQFKKGASVMTQVAPPLVEVLISPGPLSAATNLLPSAEDATDTQRNAGTLFEIHETPAFVEV